MVKLVTNYGPIKKYREWSGYSPLAHGSAPEASIGIKHYRGMFTRLEHTQPLNTCMDCEYPRYAAQRQGIRYLRPVASPQAGRSLPQGLCTVNVSLGERLISIAAVSSVSKPALFVSFTKHFTVLQLFRAIHTLLVLLGTQSLNYISPSSLGNYWQPRLDIGVACQASHGTASPPLVYHFPDVSKTPCLINPLKDLLSIY